MEGQDIKIQKCSKYYLYILLAVLLKILRSSFLSLSKLSINSNKNIFGIEIVLKNHILMELLLEYSGYIIFGFLFSKCFDKKNNKNNNKHYAKIKYLNNNKKNNFEIKKLVLISCTCFGIQLIVRNILDFCNTWCLDMWIFNIIFICIFMKYFLNQSIYKHQLYALILIFASNFMLIALSSSIKFGGLSEYDTLNNMYGSYFYIVLFYIIYLILSAFICSSQVLQKKLMDIFYVSPFIILLVTGFISIFFTLIAYIITSNVSCGESLVKQNTCPIFYPGYKNNNSFFDNFIIYLYNMSDKYKSDKTSFYLEICLVYPFYSFAFFIKDYYEILIIQYLNPNYVLIENSIFYGLKMLIILIYNPSDIKTYLTFVGEIIALIGYCFYVEIFELKCCGLNRDTKNQIFGRALIDVSKEDICIINEDEDIPDDEKSEKEKEMIKMINIEMIKI